MVMQIQHILVATDLNDGSQSPLEYARSMATLFRAHLHVLHVVPDATREPWAAETVGVNLGELTDDWLRDADLRLRTIVKELSRGPLSVTPVVRLGTAAEQILAYTAEHHMNLIVLGRHDHGVVARALRGSTVDRVVRKATCPVVTVPPAEPGVIPRPELATTGREATS
jgi:nucleotide-binding universal stress UspA family protein